MYSENEAIENAKKAVTDFAVLQYENEKNGNTDKATFYKNALFGAKMVAWYALRLDLDESAEIENEIRKTFFPEKRDGEE
jgi:hypothetical protein